MTTYSKAAGRGRTVVEGWKKRLTRDRVDLDRIVRDHHASYGIPPRLAKALTPVSRD